MTYDFLMSSDLCAYVDALRAVSWVETSASSAAHFATAVRRVPHPSSGHGNGRGDTVEELAIRWSAWENRQSPQIW